MHNVFGPRPDEASKYLINLNEEYDSYPGLFDDPLTADRVEAWLCNRLLGPKYHPAQVATLWRLMEFIFSEYYSTLLLRKILGRIEDHNTPLQFVRTYRRILMMRKFSNTHLQEIHELAVPKCGDLVLQTALKGGISDLEWKTFTPPERHLVLRELYTPVHTGLCSVARNGWTNPV
jgi:hypothetical protein